MKRQTLNLITPSGSSRRVSKEDAHLAVLLGPWLLLLELPSLSWISTKHSSDSVTTQRLSQADGAYEDIIVNIHCKVITDIVTKPTCTKDCHNRLSLLRCGSHYSFCCSDKTKQKQLNEAQRGTCHFYCTLLCPCLSIGP